MSTRIEAERQREAIRRGVVRTRYLDSIADLPVGDQDQTMSGSYEEGGKPDIVHQLNSPGATTVAWQVRLYLHEPQMIGGRTAELDLELEHILARGR